MRHAGTVAGASLVALFSAGCRSEPPPVKRARAPAVSAKPVDRLAPGELAPGKSRVFGLELPRGMTVRGAFYDVAYVEGDVPPEGLANYVRDRVEVENVEVGAARTVFPQARIKGGDAERLYQLEVIAHGRRSELLIKDVTPRPKPAPNLTDAERWRAIGRDPNGKPLDMAELR